MTVEEAIASIADEVKKTQARGEPFHSAHEGFAIIAEEFEELKAEVWKSRRTRDYDAMLKESRHLAAMAARLMIEIAAPRKEAQS